MSKVTLRNGLNQAIKHKDYMLVAHLHSAISKHEGSSATKPVAKTPKEKAISRYKEVQAM